MNSATTSQRDDEQRDLFTAAEFAGKMGCKPQYVRKLLCRKVPAGEKIVRGNTAQLWSIGALPSPLLGRLLRESNRNGFETPIEYMQSAAQTPAPANLSRLVPGEIAKAQKLKGALAPCLQLPAGTSISERARVAADDYRREFGRSVSDRHLRASIGKVLQRDSGRREFDRLELYVPESPRKRIARPTQLGVRADFHELREAIGTIRDFNRPTISEIAYCWREALKMIRDRIAAGANEIKLKQQLRDYIVKSAPFLGATPTAAKRNINRKLRAAIDGGGIGQLTDGRLNPARKQTARDGLARFPKDVELLKDHAKEFCRGNPTQAHRELHTGSGRNGKRFSEEFRAWDKFDPRKAKSQLRSIIRRAVAPGVRSEFPATLGPRAQRNARPKRHLDWSNVASGDWYSGDDVTGNHYVYEFRPDGQYECDEGRFNCGRAQWLITIDEKSQNPLGVSVRLSRSYDKFMILAGSSRVALDPCIGNPHRGWTLEKGRYATPVVHKLADWSRVDDAFLREGMILKIHHAAGPTGKTRVENAIGRIQSMFDFGPGYVGRDERHIQYERVNAFLARLKQIDQPRKQAIHPGDTLMSLEEYEAELAISIERFANEPQNGEILRDGHGRGLSPKEAWSYFDSGRPHTVLPASLMFLMCTDASTQRVKADGVHIDYLNTRQWYCDRTLLDRFLGERVIVRYNPDFPEHAAISHAAEDPRGKHAISVAMCSRIPAKDATRDDFARTSIPERQFAVFGKTYHRVFRPASNLTISKSSFGSPELRAGGERFNELQREHVELTERRESGRSSIRRLAASLNRTIDPGKVRNPDRVKKHLESAARARQRILERENASANPPGEAST